MGLASHGLALGIGYLLGQPQGRERLRKVGQQATDLTRRPEVARLREQTRSVAAEKVEAVRQKVTTRAPKNAEDTGTATDAGAQLEVRPRRRIALPTQRPRFRRSRDVHFPASADTTAPTAPGGTTVMEDSEAMRGRHAATPSDPPASTTDGS